MSLDTQPDATDGKPLEPLELNSRALLLSGAGCPTFSETPKSWWKIFQGSKWERLFAGY
jgi:hypothetical protein